MTRKITTLLLVLMCALSNVMAQKVASQATTIDALESGYYMIVAKSAKSNANGNLVYTDGSNVRIDHKSKDINEKIGKVFLDSDNDKYIWYISKSGNTINLKSYTNNNYWHRYASASSKESTVDRDNISMGSTVNTYDIVKNQDYVQLTIENTYYKFPFGASKTVYVTDCRDENSSDDGNLGYRRTPGNDVANLMFYAVEMPEQTTLTYNLYDNYTLVTSKQVTATTFRAFPSVTKSDFVKVNTQLPEYVSSADKEGVFDIYCNVTAPIVTETLFYLQGNVSTDSRMTINSSLGVHAATEQPALNDIANDLWRVEGNAFDGYKFYNVSAGKYLTYNAASWLSGASVSLSDNGSLWNVRNNRNNWDESAITDEVGKTFGFALTTVEDADLNSSNFVTVGSSVGIGAADNAGTLMLVDPIFSLKLNYSAADNASFATSCLPYNVEVADGDAKMYLGAYNEDHTKLEMTETSPIAANQGFVLRSETAQDKVTLRVVASADELYNDLKGTTTEITDMSNILSFGRLNGNGKVGFFRSTNDHLSANRAYIIAGNRGQAVPMSFVGVTTSIDAVNTNNQTANAPIYDLAGRRVNKVVKGGIYIQGGNKSIAK